MVMDKDAAVLLECREGVAWVTLNRPDLLNALNGAMMDGLVETFTRLRDDDAIRAVVLRGAGRGFMAGGDLGTFRRMLDEGTAQAGIDAMIGRFHEALDILARLDKPTLACIHGVAAGAGVSLALACDLAIAADDTRFTLAYSRIATSPDGGATWFLPRIVGQRKALEIALLGDQFDAVAARDLGLVNWLAPLAELEREAERIARRLATGPTVAYAGIKRLIGQSFDNDLPRQLAAEQASFRNCAGTRDFAEGIAAFFEKRAPDFTGR